MRKKIITNVLYSFAEKFASIGAQFLISIILIRLLSREDYGIIGTVVGYFVFVNFINISIESVILRDHKKIATNLSSYFSNFFFFNAAKSLCIIIIASFLSVYLVKNKGNLDYFYAITSFTSILIADSFVAPIMIYTTANFSQKIVTLFTTVRLIGNLILSLGLLIVPTIQYLAIKDIIISIIYSILWFTYFKKSYIHSFVFSYKQIDFKYLKTTIMEYSIWIHLNGVVTTFIYKADIFFLSLFYNLQVIGNYNIALTAANVANIIPMILAYQNSIAISHAKNEVSANQISNIFIKVSLVISIFIIVIYLFFGKMYLRIITGDGSVDTIYQLMIPIVVGLVIVKSIASPLVAFINIKRDTKGLFSNVLFPTFIATSIVYVTTSYFGNPLIVAISNIAVSLIWLGLLLHYIIRQGYSFKGIFVSKKDVLYLLRYLKFK